jgi:uncharacterized small protein (DUF1192 family)
MERDNIIKALECCIKAETWGDCQELGCPALTKHGCYFYLRTDNDNENALYVEMFKDALALITSQEQRIKELTEENERLQAEITHLEGHREADIKAFKTLKADTVRKMQEKLKAKAKNNEWNGTICGEDIDQIAKEMLEGEQK